MISIACMSIFTIKDINVFIFKDYLLENHLIEAITSVDLFVKMIMKKIILNTNELQHFFQFKTFFLKVKNKMSIALRV